jgi:hypothetical protein
MPNLKIVPKVDGDPKAFASVMHQVAGRLKQAGSPSSQAALLGMHLAEIDQESARYRKLVLALRGEEKPGPNGLAEDLIELLIDIELSLEHMRSHIEAVSKILGKSIDALDNSEG